MNNDSLVDLDELEQQLRETQTSIAYDTKEYVVEVMVTRFEKGFFYIPEYQRKFVWEIDRQSKFIESVIMGLPIPFLFGVQDTEGKTEILDGAQRMNTLREFALNRLVLKNLQRLDLLNGLSFSDLPASQQIKFNDRSMRMVILPETVSKQSRLDMFERINTGSEDLKKAEIRKGSFSGPFYDFVCALAEDEQFNKLCPVSHKAAKRGEREELILRFFAYSKNYLDFKHSVFNFLDDYLRDANKEVFDKKQLKNDFRAMLNYVENNLPNGFRKSAKSNTTPRVRFESIAIGINLALKSQPTLTNKGDGFIHTNEFNTHVTSHASNSGPRLRGRIEYVRDWLLGA
ncbi:DUF262 domain-containing protein [Aliivibrio sifiae]|uniref:GmrSD restriction endonucleases N-terminal domain-containing protein n=1 Tax=Aliivibrio sifiae TaxID=566293 RepID=A0A2S7X1R5_9GAMM|nr:DUF262 domain-containing protein [Aliivibrio sifiae]PQJ84112.1 hypothetical protein BTO22_11175 [Aliivibrio sifiae]